MKAERGGTGALFGLLAEFDNPACLLDAARAVRDAGYTRWDCHSPFPVHGLDRAMGLRASRLPWAVAGAGVTGTAAAVLMQWWMNARDYPIVIGGKPLFSLPANIPVAFELTVLFAAVACFAAMFFFNDLPKFFHPAFRSSRFKRATSDRFFITIEAADPQFDPRGTVELLRSLDCTHLEGLEG